MMPVPKLDLHGLRHHEVENEVVRFLERHLNSGLFLEIITGNSQIMLQESVKIIQQYGLQYHTGFPHHAGRVLVITYDDLH
jgi:DNA-nicking Smr family endonuclease